MDEGLSQAVLKVFVELYRDGPDLQGQAAGQLGPEAARPRSPTSKCSRSRSRAISGTSTIRSKDCRRRLHHRRDHAAGDDAGRHRGRGASGRRALQAPGRQARDPAAGRPPHPDRRRRLLRSGEGHRRGEDHAGARLQRLRGRQAARPAADQHARPSRASSTLDEQRRRSSTASPTSRRARRDAGSCTASTASRRASRSSSAWRRRACSTRSSRTRTWCRTATARTW